MASPAEKRNRWRKVIASSYLFLRKGQRYLPPLLRGLLGLLVIACGFLGFLPILGFWMIPLGLALLATDVPPLRHWFTGWLNRQRKKKQQ